MRWLLLAKKMQASVGAEPLEPERIARGKQVVVNGRTLRATSASFLLVRRSRLKHVAIVPNGADGSTSVHIAAEAAATKEFDMEFATWVTEQGFEADALSDQQQTSLRAMYDARPSSGGTISASALETDRSSVVVDLRAHLGEPALDRREVVARDDLAAREHARVRERLLDVVWREPVVEPDRRVERLEERVLRV